MGLKKKNVLDGHVRNLGADMRALSTRVDTLNTLLDTLNSSICASPFSPPQLR